jgi:uridine kinase
VVLDGPGGSGKSTPARELAAAYAGKVANVRGDHLYADLDDGHRATLDAADGEREYVDWRRLRDQVFVRAREGEPITYQKYDSSTYCSSCCWLQVLRDRPIVTVLTGHLYNDMPSSLTHR